MGFRPLWSHTRSHWKRKRDSSLAQGTWNTRAWVAEGGPGRELPAGSTWSAWVLGGPRFLGPGDRGGRGVLAGALALYSQLAEWHMCDRPP